MSRGEGKKPRIEANSEEGNNNSKMQSLKNCVNPLEGGHSTILGAEGSQNSRRDAYDNHHRRSMVNLKPR